MMEPPIPILLPSVMHGTCNELIIWTNVRRGSPAETTTAHQAANRFLNAVPHAWMLPWGWVPHVAGNYMHWANCTAHEEQNHIPPWPGTVLGKPATRRGSAKGTSDQRTSRKSRGYTQQFPMRIGPSSPCEQAHVKDFRVPTIVPFPCTADPYTVSDKDLQKQTKNQLLVSAWFKTILNPTCYRWD